jgi:hypothetical protein
MPGSYARSGSTQQHVRMWHVELAFCVVWLGLWAATFFVTSNGHLGGLFTIGSLWVLAGAAVIILILEFLIPLYYVGEWTLVRKQKVVLYDPQISMLSIVIPASRTEDGWLVFHASNLISANRGSGASSSMVWHLLTGISSMNKAKIVAIAQNDQIRDRYYVRTWGFRVIKGRRLTFP